MKLGPGNLLRFGFRDASLSITSSYVCRLYVQALFQSASGHTPLRIEDLVASIRSNNMELVSTNVEMQDYGEGTWSVPSHVLCIPPLTS